MDTLLELCSCILLLLLLLLLVLCSTSTPIKYHIYIGLVLNLLVYYISQNSYIYILYVHVHVARILHERSIKYMYICIYICILYIWYDMYTSISIFYLLCICMHGTVCPTSTFYICADIDAALCRLQPHTSQLHIHDTL